MVIGSSGCDQCVGVVGVVSGWCILHNEICIRVANLTKRDKGWIKLENATALGEQTFTLLVFVYFGSVIRTFCSNFFLVYYRVHNIRTYIHMMLSLSLHVYQVRLDWFPLPCFALFCLDSTQPAELPQ